MFHVACPKKARNRLIKQQELSLELYNTDSQPNPDILTPQTLFYNLKNGDKNIPLSD